MSERAPVGAASVRDPGDAVRGLLIAATAVLHLGVYAAVNAWNVRRHPSRYRLPRLSLDDRIPYVPWTVPLYYASDLYIIFGGARVVWGLETAFRRAIAAYAVMIVAGAAMQVFVPIPGPWPDSPTRLQRFFHGLPGVDRYAALPSMHVALATLPAGIAWSTRAVADSDRSLNPHPRPRRRDPSGRSAAAHLMTAAGVALSTLTTKEHWIADVVAGAALGVAAWAWWKRGA